LLCSDVWVTTDGNFSCTILHQSLAASYVGFAHSSGRKTDSDPET
jgi:hypothetical protein